MAISWVSKDPDETDTRRHDFAAKMDVGETVTAYTATRISGTVEIDTPASFPVVPSVNHVDFMLSGGADGETSVFDIEWTTSAGRTLNETIVLPIVSTSTVALVTSGYVAPTPANLIAMYPEFASVAVSTIQMWLDRAARSVDESWTEGDFPYARMALAAHLMAGQGMGLSGAASGLPEGVTNFRSGSFSVSISDKAASQSVEVGYGSTRYGRAFAVMLRQNKGGARVTASGYLPCNDGFNGYAGPMPPWAA